FKSANRWLNQQGFTKLKFTKAYQDTLGTKDYQDLSKYKGAQVTGGTIFSGRVDKTHPIGFGYAYSKLPVFVNGNLYFDQPNNPYASPFIFSETPLESGYVSEENLDRLKSSPGIVISKMGSGKIVSFAFNTNFRAFWYGTNKLLLNAIFFGEVIDNRSAE
ncbi:MAG: zinc carboxypeptidase, partial [Cyclobacteriaceae bacterium]|nr:zinc carboxypeptidase [Cyclobacteriaceae bacterium HetDA_MAG_MS6]